VQFLKGKTKDEKSLNILGRLEESTHRGADMVKQILSFARGAAEEKVSVNLGQIVNEVVSMLKQTTPENVKIMTSLPEDLPGFRGDVGQLYQALMNLCENAVEAMPMGGNLSITGNRAAVDKNLQRMQAGAPAGEYTLLEISDTGIGIPANILPKIFDPFFTTKETERKLGLGLSTAAIVVKTHGGFIDVQSKVGGGTTLSLYLPVEEAEVQAGRQHGRTEFPKGKGQTILIVDDEMSVVEMTRNTLELYDYNALTATDGARAVAIYEENKDKISAVILDLMMPVMDGRATLKALRGINPGLKAIIITGSTQAPEEKLMLDANAYLKKPYGIDVLLNVLSDVLKS
ncbi:MAG TPA: ATP-binding protein, partial [Candidatus Kryptobacter bacterium]|nr:ATP-binding protein [Candidatus Kryptobacter bacterium]